jgi:ferrous iron transport protein A
MAFNFWGWRQGGRGKGWGRGGWRGGPYPAPYMPPTQIPEGAIPLERVPAGTTVKVVAILAGVGASNRIYQMGIAPGSILEVVDNNLAYPWTPILVKVHGMVVALGRGLASRIFVVPIPKEQTGIIQTQPEKQGIPEE